MNPDDLRPENQSSYYRVDEIRSDDDRYRDHRSQCPKVSKPSTEESKNTGKKVFDDLKVLVTNPRETRAVDAAALGLKKDELNKALSYACTLTESDEMAAAVTFAIMKALGMAGGRRKSRLNVQRRRTQRHRGGRKHRKLRKLATRRR